MIIERGNDGTFDACMEVYPDLKFSLMGQGKTVSEAKEDFHTTYKEMKELFEERGEKIEELNFNFKFDIPSFLQYYAFAFTLDFDLIEISKA